LPHFTHSTWPSFDRFALTPAHFIGNSHAHDHVLHVPPLISLQIQPNTTNASQLTLSFTSVYHENGLCITANHRRLATIFASGQWHISKQEGAMAKRDASIP
jgi:hypothetical protein